MTNPADRVWSMIPAGAREILERRLSPTDLQTLLLDLAHTRAAAVTPARLAERWRSDRFVAPTVADPRSLARVAAALWTALPAEFVGLVLSPVTPLGTSRAVGAADQNRVLSTVRNLEVVSDPTNVLALEVARRRSGSAAAVHLAAQQRVLRHQRFEPPFGQHFELFALVSGDRDHGDFRTETALMRRHLAAWSAGLDATLGTGRWQLAYTIIDEQARAVLHAAVDELPITTREDPARQQGIGYYRTLAFKIMAGDREIGDGGFVDWTAQLRADAKERCLISCVATERLASD